MAKTSKLKVEVAPTLEQWIEEAILNNPALQKELDRPAEETSAEIVAMANEFLTRSQKLLDDYNNYNRHAKIISKKKQELKKLHGKDIDYNSFDEYKTLMQDFEKEKLDKSLILDLYKEINDFQVKLNHALAQEVQYIQITQDDTGNPLIIKVKEEDLLTADVASASHGGGLSARFSKNALNLLQDANSSAELVTFLEDEVENINVIQQIYRSVMYKIDNYRVTGPNGKETSLILWHNPTPPPPWKRMLMNNRGDVGEAYAAAALQEDLRKQFAQYNEFTYDIFMNLIADVDNISGMLQGDVRDGQVEYAIKAMGASALAVIQFVKMAKDIQKTAAAGKLFDTRALLKKQYELAKKGVRRNQIEYVEELVATQTEAMIQALGIELK